MSLLKEIKTCEVCNSNNYLNEVLNLGDHPLCDDLVPVNTIRTSKLYPITILLCTNCYTAHQKYQIPKKVLFPSDYHYRGKFTKDVIDRMNNLVDECEFFIKNISGLKVLDI